jgi:hypothetical protein
MSPSSTCSDPTDILIVHFLSATLPVPCTLALSNQRATVICWMQSNIFLKPRLYYQLSIQAIQQLNTLSLPSFSSNVILIVSKLDENLHMMTKSFELFQHASDHSPASAKDRFDAAVRWAREATPP